MCKWHYYSLSHQKFRGFNLRKSSLLLIWNFCSLYNLNKFPQLSFFKGFLSCYTLPRSCWNGHYSKAFHTWKEYYHDITNLRSTNNIHLCWSHILQSLQLFPVFSAHTGIGSFAHAVFLFIECPYLSSFSCFHHSRSSPNVISWKNIPSDQFWQN